MLRKLLVVGALALFFGNCGLSALAKEKECNCKAIAEAKHGFCDTCNEGRIYGERLTSRQLYEALHGHNTETAKIHCDSCIRANEKNARCTSCKVSFAHKRMYRSPMAHAIALGKPYTAAKASHCDTCKKAFAHNEFCDECKVGFNAKRLYHSHAEHKQAKHAHEIIREAIKIARECENCAVAMVNNAKCEKCNARFQDGRCVSKKYNKEERKTKKHNHDDE